MARKSRTLANLGTVAELAQDLLDRGADLEVLAARAVRIASKRGYVTAGLANGTSIIAAKHLGLIRRDKRCKGGAKYRLTTAGKKVATP